MEIFRYRKLLFLNMYFILIYNNITDIVQITSKYIQRTDN